MRGGAASEPTGDQAKQHWHPTRCRECSANTHLGVLDARVVGDAGAPCPAVPAEVRFYRRVGEATGSISSATCSEFRSTTIAVRTPIAFPVRSL